MAKRRMSEKDRAYLERTRLQRLREDYTGLTMGQRVEQGAQLSFIGTELARQVAGRR